MPEVNRKPSCVLFLASNAVPGSHLALDEEFRSIRTRVKASRERDGLHLVSEWAARIDDLQTHLLEHSPTVLHFSGHGSKDPEGLVFVGEGGACALMDATALGSIFRVLKDNIRLVVLNACYSEKQAEAIVQHIGCVVGMRKAIGDMAAIKFAGAFYEATAYRRSVQDAFDLGVASLQAHQIPEDKTPRLLVAPGVDASSLYLVAAPNCDGAEGFEYTILFTGRIDPKDKPEVHRLFREICKLSRDTTLELVGVEAGSLIMRLRGSINGFGLLRSQFRSGDLSGHLRMYVEAVYAGHGALPEDLNPAFGTGLRVGNITAKTAIAGDSTFNSPFNFDADPAQLVEIKAQLAAIQSGTLSAATIKTKGNLAAAKVSPNRFFTGRVDELSRLHAALASGSVAIVHALAGEGGIGKTELAKAYALIFAGEYGGVWWIDASANALSAELAKVYKLATGADAPPGVGVPELGQALADRWAGEKHLVVLDNVDKPENFTLFGGMARGRVLATTRELEKTLAGVMPFRVDVLPTKDAVELLRKEIAGNRADVTDADLTAIAEELGGHALAVALAGAYLANYADVPASVVLTKLRASGVGDIEPVDDESKHDPLGLPYRRSVAASLSLHFEKEDVKPVLPVLLAAAYLHPTGIPIGWLAVGTGWTVDEVRKAARVLDKHSIIRYDLAISVHRLTQGVMRTTPQVTQRENREATLMRLLEFLIYIYGCGAGYSERLLDHTKNPTRLAAMAHAEAVTAHISALIAGEQKSDRTSFSREPLLLGTGPNRMLSAKAAQLSFEIARFLRNVGQLASAEKYIDAAIGWGETNAPRNERVLFVYYLVRSTIRLDLGNIVGAELDLNKTIDWCESQSPRDERGLAVCYASRAHILQIRGDYAGALADIQKCIDWGEAQLPRAEDVLSMWYGLRASIRVDVDDFAGAGADIQKSIEWEEAQSPPNQRSLAIAYASRASITHDRGDLVGAEADIEKSIDLSEAQFPRDERGLANRYALRARIRRDQAIAVRNAGDTTKAAALFARAKADIAKALMWFEKNLPEDERSIHLYRKDQALIEEAERGGP